MTSPPGLSEYQQQILGYQPQVARVMTNPVRVGAAMCLICTAPVAQGLDVCFGCRKAREQAGVLYTASGVLMPATANLVVPLTYAMKPGQAWRDMWAYKSPTPNQSALTRLRILTATFQAFHSQCADRAVGIPITAVALVPSLSGRVGDHPLTDIARFLPSAWERIPLLASDQLPADNNARREPNPDHFKCPVNLDGRHVAVFEDTWVSGGHPQGAARCVRLAGAAAVTILVLARFLNPDWTEQDEFWTSRSHPPYDYRTCPITGGACPA